MEVAIKNYLKGLDQQKKYFRDLEKHIPQTIVEAGEEDENEDETDEPIPKRSGNLDVTKQSNGNDSKLSQSKSSDVAAKKKPAKHQIVVEDEEDEEEKPKQPLKKPASKKKPDSDEEEEEKSEDEDTESNETP